MVVYGSICVVNVVNIVDGKNDLLKGFFWFEELNNVVLICLILEVIIQLEKIVCDKRLVDENGCLYGKVFSILFGESFVFEWFFKGL